MRQQKQTLAGRAIPRYLLPAQQFRVVKETFEELDKRIRLDRPSSKQRFLHNLYWDTPLWNVFQQLSDAGKRFFDYAALRHSDSWMKDKHMQEMKNAPFHKKLLSSLAGFLGYMDRAAYNFPMSRTASISGQAIQDVQDLNHDRSYRWAEAVSNVADRLFYSSDQSIPHFEKSISTLDVCELEDYLRTLQHINRMRHELDNELAAYIERYIPIKDRSVIPRTAGEAEIATSCYGFSEEPIEPTTRTPSGFEHLEYVVGAINEFRELSLPIAQRTWQRYNATMPSRAVNSKNIPVEADITTTLAPTDPIYMGDLILIID